jgi:hypothetical protein
LVSGKSQGRELVGMSVTNLYPSVRPLPTGTDDAPDASALIVVIRTPKSASTSLATIVEQAFSDARSFILPNTLDIEGGISALQHLRHIRHAARINYRSHRLLRLSKVFARINAEAAAGDLVTGGHIDFATCRRHLARSVKFVTLIRDPVARSVSEYTYARAGFQRKSYLEKIDASLVAKAAGRLSFEGYLDFLTDHRAAFADIACRYVGLSFDDDIAAHFTAHAYHFGTVDNLAAFTNGLARKTDKAVPVRHLNPTDAPARLRITASEHRKLERLYARDFELYEWVRAHEPQARQQRRPVPAAIAATA